VAKQTLLQIVQDILSSLNSDNVNSITDTREAQQVAVECRRVFFNMVNSKVWPSTEALIQLDASVDLTKPNFLILKEAVIHMDDMKYDCRKAYADPPDYQSVIYKDYRDFLEIVMNRNPGDSRVTTVMDYRGTPLFIYNDCAPTYFSSFDDTHIVFDSYNSAVDSTVQSSKTQAFSRIEPSFVLSNDFIPDIPAHLFSYYTTECLAWSFVIIKEMANEKVELVAAEQKAWLSQNKHRIKGQRVYPDYGRKGRV
jgi:hypothetical protein